MDGGGQGGPGAPGGEGPALDRCPLREGGRGGRRPGRGRRGSRAAGTVDAPDEGADLRLQGPGQIVLLRQDPVLRGPVPALDLASGLEAPGGARAGLRALALEPSSLRSLGRCGTFARSGPEAAGGGSSAAATSSARMTDRGFRAATRREGSSRAVDGRPQPMTPRRASRSRLGAVVPWRTREAASTRMRAGPAMRSCAFRRRETFVGKAVHRAVPRSSSPRGRSVAPPRWRAPPARVATARADPRTVRAPRQESRRGRRPHPAGARRAIPKRPGPANSCDRWGRSPSGCPASPGSAGPAGGTARPTR